jgi:hypothetical protein
MELLTPDAVDAVLDYALDYNDASEYIKKIVKHDAAIRSRLIELIIFCQPELIFAKSRIAEAAEAVLSEAYGGIRPMEG